MKIIDKFKNRYNLVSIILLILMIVLSFRLATLTIAEGDHYREISDNKRLKEIYTTAPRGEIRDRYGRLLAGNIPSFTVQLLKDELNIKDIELKNDGLLRLVRLLEEDGVIYADDYPLEFNIFKYNNQNDYFIYDVEPTTRVIDIVIENNLLPEILRMYYVHPDYEEHYQHISINRAINALKNKSISIPIITEIENGLLSITFDETKNISNWKNEYGIPTEYSPIQSIIKLVDNDKTIIRKMLDHPISRLMVYELLVEKGLSENISIDEFSISFMEDFLNQKRTLMKVYPEVTMDTSAKEDFVNIFTKISLSPFLDQVMVKSDSANDDIIPGQVLIDLIKNKNIALDISIEIVDGNVIYSYLGTTDIGEQSPKDILINTAIEYSILTEFLGLEEIKYLAQEQLLADGVNPRISVANDFEYAAINNLNKWYSQNNIDEGSTLVEAFEKARDRYSISTLLSKYEVRAILAIYDQLDKQGHLAYQPINIAYGIKESTVAKIEEGLMDMPGIKISIEPVRYYPEGMTASHILGYLGKISQSNEIEKYVVQNNYSPSTIIGKTGIEESFEDILSGKSGIKRVEVDVVGNTTNVIEEIKPIPGDNVYLSMDLDVQKVAEESLQQTLEKLQVAGTYESKWGDYKFGINKTKRRPYINATSGALVAVDVKTGEVIAMAVYPGYDPNLFSTGISDSDWESLFPEDEKDPLAPRPLYNIATQTAIQPGSIYKMIPALAALDKGLDPEYKIRDMGYVDIGPKRFNDFIWTLSRSTHGYENVYEALRDSCNYYFYSLALGRNQRTNQELPVKLEIEDIVNLSKQFGLNDKTGIEINIPAEVSGGVPDPQQKIITTKYLLKRYLNNNIERYIKDGVSLDQEEIDSIIAEIISWVELEELLTRNEVIRRLDVLGIDPEKQLPGEREGLADKIKYTYINQAGWNITDTLNVVIGQGENSYTPIQMANFVATISNGGHKQDLTLINNIKNYDNTETSYEHTSTPERIKINDYNDLEYIKKGMGLVSSEGTARSIFQKFPIEVGSKTGTAQRAGINPSTGDTYDEFAWFVGFAPYDEPEIAVAAVIFQGGSGGYAGPMVRDVIAQYLGLNNTESEGNLPYENILINE